MKKAGTWKKAAACAFALAFLLSACGASTAKSESAAAGEGDYAAGNGAYSVATQQSYGSAYREESYDDDWDEEVEMEMAADEAMPMAAAAADGAGGSAQSSGTASDQGSSAEQADLKSPNRKIVYTGNVSLQTLEYDKSSQSIHEKITQCGGFIESEDTYNEDPYWYYSDRSGSAANRTRRNLNITARIPAGKFDAFMKDLENDGQVTNTSVNARNISVSYATHDASRKALEIEKGRLLDMMDKAETVEEMIAVEERLTEVERELGDEMTQLSAMDRDVDFSTVYISLQEVFEYSEKVVEVTFGERLQRAFGRAIDGFVEFWQDVILFVAETFPFLIMLAIVIFLIVKLHRRNHRRRMEKRAKQEEERRRAMQAAGGAYASGAYGDAGYGYGAYGAQGAPGRTGGIKGLFRRRGASGADPGGMTAPAPGNGTGVPNGSAAGAAGTNAPGAPVLPQAAPEPPVTETHAPQEPGEKQL